MECYNLKWSDYSSTLTSFLTEALYNEEFCDAKIVCGGKQYAVHRLVLSLGSEFFENIFKNTSCCEPLLILEGIDQTHLEGILLFIYTGKVIMPKDSMSSFLNAAKSLHIKGLSSPHAYYNHPKKKSTGNNNYQFENSDKNCDFLGFSQKLPSRIYSTSLPILKEKLNKIEIIDKSKEACFAHKEICSTNYINGVKNTESRLSNTQLNIFRDNFKQNLEMTKMHPDKVNKDLLQPIENFTNIKFSCIIPNQKTSTDKKHFFLPNSICPLKFIPFVQLERLTDSVVHAANKGLKRLSNELINFENDFSNKRLKMDSNDVTEFNYPGLHMTCEKEISKSVSVKDQVNKVAESKQETMKENIASSLRRMKQCAYCLFKTKSRFAMNKHLQSHKISSAFPSLTERGTLDKPRVFLCGICSFKSESKKVLSKHQFIKHGHQKTLSCQFCSYQCCIPSLMKKHNMLHKKEKLYKCSICPFSSKKQMELYDHKKQKHSSNSKHIETDSVKRSHSFFSLSNNTDLFNRVVNYKEGESFKCQFCIFTSSSKSVIKGHEAYHSNDEEPFKCRFCPYKSAIRTIVKCHEMTH